MTHLRLATRGSPLALAQAEHTRALLAAAAPEVEVEFVIIRTSGDGSTGSLVASGGVGVFVKELETALLAGEADAAVHSLKDLPTVLPPGLVLAAMLEREDMRDALITRAGGGLNGLRQGAVVATGSPRRQAQLRAVRPDLTFCDVRGNVGTRIEKLQAGGFDALCLAVAGLKRLGRGGEISEALDPSVMLPAPGQAAIAIEVGAGSWAEEVIARLDHPPTRYAVEAERRFLLALGGGCTVPVGALGRVDGDTLSLEGMVADPVTGVIVRLREEGTVASRDVVARRLAERVAAAGGSAILARQPGARPLANCRVVVTGSDAGSGEMRARLEGLGAFVAPCPAIEIGRPRWWSRVIAAAKYLNGFDLVAVTSKNGARALLDAIDESPVGRDEVTVRIAAVGPGTARVLEDGGLTVAVVPENTSGAGLAAALVADLGAGAKVLWVRGQEVAFDLGEALRDAGMEVMESFAYYAAVPADLDLSLAETLAGGGLDIIVFSSPRAVQNVVDAAHKEASLSSAVRATAVACIGPTTAVTAEAAGFAVAVCPERATPEELVGGITRWFMDRTSRAGAEEAGGEA